MIPSLAALLKSAERGWRALWIRVLTRLMRRAGPPGDLPAWGARPQRVLFLRHDRIGDMILSTGVIRAIAQSAPTITLDVLASPTNAPVLDGNPHVDSVIVFDRTKPRRYAGVVRRLRRARYDAVIDCMPTAPSLTTLLLILASGARNRIGVAGRGNDAAFTLLVRPNPEATHIVDQLAALATAFGVDSGATDFRPRLYLAKSEQAWAAETWRSGRGDAPGRRLLVNVSSGRAFRRWPDDRFIAAIQHARARNPDLAVLVVGGPGEWDRATAIATASGVPFVRTATLREAIALVATADLVLTPDTGLAHAASAFDRPAVVMHIRGTARQWGPYRSAGSVVSSPDGLLTSLPVHTVLAEVDRLIDCTAGPGETSVESARIGHFVA